MRKGREQSTTWMRRRTYGRITHREWIPQNPGTVTHETWQGMSKVFLSSDPRQHFWGAKCSTHFPRLTRLGQWMPRGTNPGDKGAFIARINGHYEDGSSLVQHIGLINNPRHICLSTDNPRHICLGTGDRGITVSACTWDTYPMINRRLSIRCEAGSSLISSSPKWPEPTVSEVGAVSVKANKHGHIFVIS